MNQVMWNPWHGCTKVSAGCQNCYVDRLDKRFGRDPRQFFITNQLQLPVTLDKHGNYKYPRGTKFMVCFTSDFLLDKADHVRQIAWDCIAERDDCDFMFVTKRIDRFTQCIPNYWSNKWHSSLENVTVCLTCENQQMLEQRMPIFAELPIARKRLVLEPMLEDMDLRYWLNKYDDIESIACGGESGSGARQFDFKWALNIASQCNDYNVPFWFKQTGAKYINDSGQLVNVARCNQYDMADFEGISTCNWMYDDDVFKSKWLAFGKVFGTHQVWHYPQKTGKFEPWMNFVVTRGQAIAFIWDTREFLFTELVEDLPYGYVRTPDNFEPVIGYDYF